MCLDRVYGQKSVDRLPDKIVAYKVVHKCEKGYYPICYNAATPFMKGLNVSRRRNITKGTTWSFAKYRPYYHCYATLSSAKTAGWRGAYIIKVYINKKDVECVGSQDGRVIVTRKFTIKSFKEVK